MKDNIFIVCFDYQEIERRHLTIKEGQKVEADYPLTESITHTKFLKSGLIASMDIPNSHLQSILETLQLYQFVMVEQEEVSLPILQKIKDDTCTDDEKCFLFLECIDDDLILLDALRYDKHQYEEGELSYKIA